MKLAAYKKGGLIVQVNGYSIHSRGIGSSVRVYRGGGGGNFINF